MLRFTVGTMQQGMLCLELFNTVSLHLIMIIAMYYNICRVWFLDIEYQLVIDCRRNFSQSSNLLCIDNKVC